VDRREEKKFREELTAKYADIDPETAKRDTAALNELFDDRNPRYAAERAMLEDDGSNPRLKIARALADTSHPEHLRITRLVQQAIAGVTPKRPEPLTPPGQLPPGIYDESTGELDTAKLAAWQTERERLIAQGVAKRAAEQLAAKQEPPSNGGERDALTREFESFCAYEDIDPATSAPLLNRAFNLMQADGIQVPSNAKGFKMLWDRVQDERKSKLAETQAAEVARVKRASTSQPRSATPDSGPVFRPGMTLLERAIAEGDFE
jgi:hypothetical protein